jgi:hypothetical protein
MQKSIIKFAPQMMVLAVSLYWCWPALQASFLQGAHPIVQEVKKPALPLFAADILHPKFLPLPKRNSFLALDYKPKKGGRGRLAASGKKILDPAEKAAAFRDAGMILNATCIMGNQRMAIINGRVYKEKDSIPQPGDEAPSCFVTAILPHKVLLSYQGELQQLGYTNVISKPVATTTISNKSTN